MSGLEELNEELNRARSRRASAEELHAIMIPMAEEAERLGQSQAATRIRRSARSLVPMFGMHSDASRRRKWWRIR